MSQSLDKLASNLNEDQFIYTDLEGCRDPSLLPLLKKKGVYPYKYMDSFRKFEETRLPDKKNL